MKQFLISIMLFFMCAPALANGLDYSDFTHIPIQHEGRIKPIDTVGRIYLKNFSGRENLGDIEHNAWLAEVLFNPAESMQRPVFRIFRPDLLDLPEKDGKLYSYTDLATALGGVAPSIEKLRKTDETNWSEDQRELARLQEYSILYTQLLRSFSLILPLGITPPPVLLKEWKVPEGKTMTLQDIRRYQERLDAHVKKIVKSKGDDPERYSDQERTIVAFAYEMQILLAAGENNVLLRIIPSVWDKEDDEWLSPWALTQEGKGSPQTSEIVAHWQKAAKAYAESDAGAWKSEMQSIRTAMEKNGNPFKLSLEIFYNTYHPLQSAMILYLGAFLTFAAWAMTKKQALHKGAFLILGAGWIFNMLAVFSRVLILSRPPVGTLYESILFVSMICVGIALILEARRKDGNGILIGSISGALLLFLAEGFAEDDSLRMLVAVLNTNFWLGTHVLCITIGYGLCLITAGYAHLYLARRVWQSDKADDLVKPVKTLALMSLLFTAIGTILGGIWADQSWGRFWGWDPKENGALLIVLWLIWMLHGQLSGHLPRVAFMIVTSLLSVVVALAWFGVNLLNVGLHSYGFVTGVAGGLGAFCMAEFLLIGFLWFRIHRIKETA